MSGSFARASSRVRLRARRRLAWLACLGEAGAAALLDDRDAPEAEAAWDAPEVGPLTEEIAALPPDERLTTLAHVFGLTAPEADLLELCAVATLDPDVRKLCALLSGGRPVVTAELAARLYGHGRTLVLGEEHALLRWELVRLAPTAPGEPPACTIDPAVARWLIGAPALSDVLAGLVTVVAPEPPLAGWPVDDVAAAVQRVFSVPGGRVRVRVTGPEGSGRRTFAAAVCARLGLRLLAVHADGVDAAAWPRLHAHAQRQAWIDGAALAWVGAKHAAPPLLPAFPLQFVLGGPGEPVAPAPGVVDHAVELPLPEAATRAALWRAFLPAAGGWSPDELTGLARRHRVTIGEIRAVAAHAVERPEEAARLVRELARGGVSQLAQRLDCPFRWEDLVLPPPLSAALSDLHYEAAARAAFWEEPAARRLFPQGNGLLALFCGPPGTGKTMAAQTIAGELGLDLFRIDLSAIVSKYVGETSKNLERVLAAAARTDAFLFFDEADALFGKRTEIKDAHDRYANTDTNYLLQAIESYPGFAVLATNKRGNIDPAFVRRLRHTLEFALPDARERALLWTRLVGELGGEGRREALDRTIGALAQAVDLSGAQIKFAVLNGLFAARRDQAPLSARHLVHGVERELWKEGRGLARADRDRLVAHG